MQVSKWLSDIAFHFGLFWLQTSVLIYSIVFIIMPESISKLLHASIWSGCADRNLNRFPFLGQLTGINLDLLLCTWLDLKNEDLFLCLIFTQRPMNDWKIEQSDGYSIGQWHVLAKSIEILISHVKKICCQCDSVTRHSWPLILQENPLTVWNLD